MATGYGGWAGGDDYRAVVSASVSGDTDTSTTATVTASASLQSLYGWASNYSSSWSATANKQTASGGGNLSFGNNQTVALNSKSVTVTKTHSAQTITCGAYVNSYAGASSASTTVTVKALKSYKVTFNANNGSGAPGAQTKWHGETLKLSTTKPTRTNYRFLGWSEDQTATTATWTAGGNYTTNASKTLYAVWQATYKDPTITSMSVYRCSNENGAQSDEGQYAYLNLGWKVNQSGSTASSVTIRYRRTTETSWTTAYTKSLTFSGTSGTAETAIYSNSDATTLLTFDTSYAYVIEATFKDSGNGNHTAKTSRTLSAAYFTFDLKSGGQGVGGIGIGHSADVAGAVRVGMDLQLDSFSYNNRERGNFACVDNRLPSSNSAANSTTATWGNGLHFFGSGFDPSSGNPIYQSHGYVRGVNLASGRRGVQIEAQRYNTTGATRYTNSLNIVEDSSGTAFVELNRSAWAKALGISAGVVNSDQSTTVNSNGYKDFSVTFPFTYSSAPYIVCGLLSTSTAGALGQCSCAVSARSGTSCTVRIFNGGTVNRSPGAFWIAFGTPSN